MSNWKYESIKIESQKRIVEKYGDASKEELIERLVELETAIYPFNYVLNSVTQEWSHGTTVFSKMFPLKSEKDTFQGYDKETGTTKDYGEIPEEDLHKIEYYLEDSIDIYGKLNDEFVVLGAHSNFRCGTAFQGEITIEDIKNLYNVYNGPYRKPDATIT